MGLKLLAGGLSAALLALARVADAARGDGTTCALPSNSSVKCPLPPWPPTYNLTESTIMYQPWCINDRDPMICTGLLNVSGWWARPENRDKGSVAEAHWGILSIDDSTSTQMWASTTYGGATPGNPLTFAAQMSMVDNCNFVKKNGWVDRCFVYDNMVVGLGWFETHRARMLDANSVGFFNRMMNDNVSLGLANYSGLPFLEPLGGLTPCWRLPNTTAYFPDFEWCGPIEDIRLPCFASNSCNSSFFDGEGFSYYWNASALLLLLLPFSQLAYLTLSPPLSIAVLSAGSHRLARCRQSGLCAFRRGRRRRGESKTGTFRFSRNVPLTILLLLPLLLLLLLLLPQLFTDEMEMFPGDDGDNVLGVIGTTQDDARAQQAAGRDAHQEMIDSLAANGKYMWQAFQAGNGIGSNTNNNSQGGIYFDAAYCTQWMAQRCDTKWVNERAITVQWDSANINVSIASFLIVRPAYAWLGGNRLWNDAFRWNFGEPTSACRNGSAPGTFERDWTFGTATMDCLSYTASVPCDPADTACGEPPHLPPAPPGPQGNWRTHNCTACRADSAQPLAEYTNVVLAQCQAACRANARCHFVAWVEPPGDGDCQLWEACDEWCSPTACWNWWTVLESLDSPPAIKWNETQCDLLPEGPGAA